MSPSFLADENADADLVLGMKRRITSIDIVRVQDVGLRTLDDPTILEWAADRGRALITRDIRTVPGFAHARVQAGLVMPGVFLLPPTVPIAVAIEELSLVAAATEAQEWINRVVYLPLR